VASRSRTSGARWSHSTESRRRAAPIELPESGEGQARARGGLPKRVAKSPSGKHFDEGHDFVRDEVEGRVDPVGSRRARCAQQGLEVDLGEEGWGAEG